MCLLFKIDCIVFNYYPLKLSFKTNICDNLCANFVYILDYLLLETTVMIILWNSDWKTLNLRYKNLTNGTEEQ